MGKTFFLNSYFFSLLKNGCIVLPNDMAVTHPYPAFFDLTLIGKWKIKSANIHLIYKFFINFVFTIFRS